jgi:hypothetical protein
MYSSVGREETKYQRNLSNNPSQIHFPIQFCIFMQLVGRKYKMTEPKVSLHHIYGFTHAKIYPRAWVSRKEIKYQRQLSNYLTQVHFLIASL